MLNSIHSRLKQGLSEKQNFSYDQRLKHLNMLENCLRESEQEIYEALRKDFEKPKFETFLTELYPVLDELKNAKKHLRSWMKTKKVKTPLQLFPIRSYIASEAKGVVLIIGAWNYPINLCLAPLIPALAAGNTVLLKPSEISNHTSALLTHLLNETFDDRVLRVVEGDGPFTSELLELKFDHIFYTGSTNVGRIIYEKAAKQLCPVTLELGGKSPSIIHESADLKRAIKRLVWGKFVNAGQTCVAPDYVLVPFKLRSEFIQLFKNEIDAQCLAETENQCQIVSDRHFNRLTPLMEGTSELLSGGKLDEKQRRISPTLIEVFDTDHALMQEEIFGPILPVYFYKNKEEIATFYAAHPDPLALYIFSKDKGFDQFILDNCPSGGVLINDTLMHLANPYLPFGGRGNSGFGSYHGVFGFQTFSHQKAIMRQVNWMDSFYRYAPYTEKRYAFLRKLISWFV